MNNGERARSVAELTNLYTVIVGVALSLSVVNLFSDSNGSSGLLSIEPVTLCLFVAFLSTLFPFYHGALRHLDETYARSGGAPTEILIFDFVLLLIHAMAFVLLSMLLKEPGQFAWALVVLLSIDVAWGVLMTFSHQEKKLNAQSKWAIINFLFVGFWCFYLLNNSIYLETPNSSLALAYLLGFLCVVRTLLDYIWCRTIYFSSP